MKGFTSFCRGTPPSLVRGCPLCQRSTEKKNGDTLNFRLLKPHRLERKFKVSPFFGRRLVHGHVAVAVADHVNDNVGVAGCEAYVPCASRLRAMTMRWICEVPS